jgi:hypothetical protein
MLTFAPKRKATPETTSVKLPMSAPAYFRRSHNRNSIVLPQRSIGNQTRLPNASAGGFEGASGTSPIPRFARDFRSVPIHDQSPALPLQVGSATGPPVDILSVDADVPKGPYIDQGVAPATPAPGPAAPPAPSPAVPAGRARPTDLVQLLTAWTPGPDQYGFQLSFRCRSTSGNVKDLQDQSPNLVWRENVTYTRNDFSGRINPPSPTILPPGGVPFAPAETKRVGQNLLEFNAATDTHWMPTSAVRSGDFRPAVPAPSPGFIGPLQLPLPAVMESRQVYQFSPNGGTTWQYLAGEFILRRTLFQDGAALKFRTQKTGVHTTTEPYKP